MPTIDIVLPTYNRSNLLKVALRALSHARVPAGHQVTLTVADNNSHDDTKAVVQACSAKMGAIKVAYVFENRQGRQFALNAGIASGVGDIVAMFDDDEQVDEAWLEVIAREFADPGVDFIGGPYRPDWQSPPPPWLPMRGYRGTVGIIDNGPARRRYGEVGFDALPVGGNFAVRRTILERCGPYATEITYAEDRYMYEQLLANNAVGYYVPDLIINHLIPTSRLKKPYFRRWAYTEGVNLAKLDRLRGRPSPGFLGIERWHWGQMLRGTLAVATSPVVGGQDPGKFELELRAIQTFAYLCERHGLRTHSYADRSRIG